MLDFDAKLTSGNSSYIIDFGTLEPDLLMMGCRWRALPEGAEIFDLKGNSMGELKPARTPIEFNEVTELHDWLVKNHNDKRIL